MIFWKLLKNIALGTAQNRLAHKTGQPYPTAAKQIVHNIFLAPTS